jgi:hypothetical protein|tara:strand:- start:1560 stop:1769 length:210 start_codon:yes stop_codon:yes gene_type:complete
MGKVKQAIEEVKEEIGTIVFDNGGDIELEEVKAILQNKYFFNDNSNPYLINDEVVKQVYEDIVEEYQSN